MINKKLSNFVPFSTFRTLKEKIPKMRSFLLQEYFLSNLKDVAPFDVSIAMLNYLVLKILSFKKCPCIFHFTPRMNSMQNYKVLPITDHLINTH